MLASNSLLNAHFVYKRNDLPGPTRPARPARWLAEAREHYEIRVSPVNHDVDLLTYRNNDERRHACPWIVRILLHESGINDEYYAIYCDRGFSNVCRQYHFPGAFGSRLEYLGLHLAGQIGIYRADDELLDFVA